MANSKKSRTPGEKTTRSVSPGEKSTKELTKRHLKDKNDKITDDDIRNIQLDTSGTSDQGVMPGGDERPHDVDKDHKNSTPWDVLKD